MKHLTKVLSLLLVSSLVAGMNMPSGFAQVKVGPQDPLPLDKEVRMGKLANGFTYFIRHNQEPKNRVVMYLANKVGSILETEEQQGLAHFMEHMSFNGTTHFPKNELINYLQKLGVRFGADINAYTNFDETIYQLPLPADNPEIVRNGIQIMHDWAHGAVLEAGEIDKERGVILEEKRLGKGAQERMQRTYFPLILNRSRYAKRMPIGTDEVLNTFKPETIRSFYRDWYRPNLQALIVVGDINIDEIERAVKAKFADLKNPTNEKTRIKYEVALTGKNQFIAVTDKEMTSTVIRVNIKHKALSLKTVNDYRSAIVRNLFNQMLGNRYQELGRQATPPFLQGEAGIEDLMGGLDVYNISVVAKPGELENGFKAVWRETRRAQLLGFTQTELDRAKQGYLMRMEAAVKEKDKTNSNNYVQEYLQLFLNQTASPGIVKENELVTGLLAGISLTDVTNVSKEYIKDTNRDIVIMAPEKDKGNLPSESVILGWMQTVNAEKLDPFKDEVSALALLTNSPVPGKVVKTEVEIKLGISTFILSNGAKVILKKTDFRNNQIVFSAFSTGGTSLYADVDFQNAVNAAGVVTAGGIGNYNATQLGKYLSGKQVGISPFIAERSQGFNGSTTPKDLETAMQLLYGYFTEPRKDGEVFKGLITNAKNGLINRSDDPNAVFGDSVNAVLGNYNIRRTGPSIEKIDQLNLDRSFQIYKERFANASDMTFVFVGSIDPGQLRPLLEKYIASLPSTGKKEEAKDLDIHIPGGIIAKTVHKGSEEKATVRLVYSGPFEYSYENSLKLGALKEALEIRLLERLREQESGVYSPNVQSGASKYPQGRFSFVISFGCSPANVERLIASAADEVSKLGKDGPVKENLDKFKAEDARSMEIALKTNGFWLNYISNQQANHEPLNGVFDRDSIIGKITVPDLKQVAAKYLDGQNYIRLVLMPEHK